MTSPPSSGTLVAILPCNDLDATERFYNRLGFVRRVESGDPDYRILSNSAGGHLHLTRAEKGLLVPGRNPFGLYLYLEDVDGLAAAFQDFRSGRRGPENKPWGMYEFAIPDPDDSQGSVHCILQGAEGTGVGFHRVRAKSSIGGLP